jgi:hypothetical protein
MMETVNTSYEDLWEKMWLEDDTLEVPYSRMTTRLQYSAGALPAADAGMYPAAHPRLTATLGSDYAAWCDALHSEPELCDCGRPMTAAGHTHADCQCCPGCGHFPCDCADDDEDDDDCPEERYWQRADTAYEEYREEQHTAAGL